ncbi:MAG: T9SS type A sorting domain-containing protein [Bacteroidales bacterium]|nr:T9SS type A sorting domain-containing protein [Bacteroidales bacterium]
MKQINEGLKFTRIAAVLITLYMTAFSAFSQSNCYTCGLNNTSSLGSDNSVTGSNSASIGNGNTVTGINSTAIGSNSSALKHTSFAVGYNAEANGIRSVALGSNTYAADYSYAFGQDAKALASTSFAFGRFVEATASGAFAIGFSDANYKLINGKINSLMIGFNSTKPTFFVGDSPSSTSTGNVGIGTSEPAAKLQIAEGDIYIEDINRGIIMKSPNGNCWKGSMSNEGMLVFVQHTCPLGLNLILEPGSKSEEQIIIAPNPTSGQIQIESSRMLNHAEVNIFSLSGNLVDSRLSTGKSISIQLGHLSTGTYIISISEGGRILKSQQIILSKMN